MATTWLKQLWHLSDQSSWVSQGYHCLKDPPRQSFLCRAMFHVGNICNDPSGGYEVPTPTPQQLHDLDLGQIDPQVPLHHSAHNSNSTPTLHSPSELCRLPMSEEGVAKRHSEKRVRPVFNQLHRNPHPTMGRRLGVGPWVTLHHPAPDPISRGWVLFTESEVLLIDQCGYKKMKKVNLGNMIKARRGCLPSCHVICLFANCTVSFDPSSSKTTLCSWFLRRPPNTEDRAINLLILKLM